MPGAPSAAMGLWLSGRGIAGRKPTGIPRLELNDVGIFWTSSASDVKPFHSRNIHPALETHQADLECVFPLSSRQ